MWGSSSFDEFFNSLEELLKKVFGEKEVYEHLQKFEKFKPKVRPERLLFLEEVKVHRAVKWYSLLRKLNERGNIFDLNSSIDVEEFMWMLLSLFAIDVLIQQDVVNIEDEDVFTKRLRSPEGFEDVLYEAIIASNYVGQGFDVEFPEVRGGRVDICKER